MLGLLGCSAGAGRLGPELSGAASGFDVLLVTLDTTRADRLGCYGHESAATPVLDDLARRGVLFRAAATVSPLTAPAHASILTGRYPPHHGVRANGTYRLEEPSETLAEMLARAGYETRAFVSSFVLDRRFGFAQGFEAYDDRVSSKVSLGMEPIMERDAKQVTDATLAWLEARSSERPFFAWVHYFDPHVAYAAPPEFATRFPDSPYDAEIAYVDSELGRLVRTLGHRDGGLDRTLIVVVADHGEALGQHGEQSHGYFIYDEVVRVPLILSAPALLAPPQPPVDAAVSVVDLVPTILDLVGIAAPGTDGKSLLSLADRSREAVYVESLGPYLEHGWSPLFGLRSERMKYIRAPRPELYDLIADPGELHDLHGDARVATERDRLARQLDELLAAWPGLDEVLGQAVPLDPVSRARLQALGYAGETTAAPAHAALADPKDTLDEYDRFQKASFAADAGRLTEAVPVLGQLVQASPGNRAAWIELAEAHAQLGRHAEAEAALRKALSIQADPDSLMLLAQILIAERRLDEVAPLVDEALALDPDFGTAVVVRGDLEVLRGRFAEARGLYERAARVDPHRVAPLVESRQAWLRKMEAAASRSR